MRLGLRAMLAAAAVMFLWSAADAAVVVSIPAKASAMERLAALEVQRYVYLRTGALPVISGRAGSERIVIARKGSSIIADNIAKDAKALGEQQYLIRTKRSGGGRPGG